MLIAEHPDATLNQLKEWGGFTCTLTTLWRTLRRFRLTYKKKTLHAGERDTPEVQAKRRRYRAKVRRIEAKRLVFVDETGVNTAMTPTHAWAPAASGPRPAALRVGFDDRDHRPGLGRTLVIDGTFPGPTDTQVFQTYVDQVLVPELCLRDVAVFDSLRSTLHVVESIQRAGRPACWPRISLDHYLIEELWSSSVFRRIAVIRGWLGRQSVDLGQCDDSGYPGRSQPQRTVRNSWVNRANHSVRRRAAFPLLLRHKSNASFRIGQSTELNLESSGRLNPVIEEIAGSWHE